MRRRSRLLPMVVVFAAACDVAMVGAEPDVATVRPSERPAPPSSDSPASPSLGFVGVVVPSERIDLAAVVSGTLLGVNVQQGDQVRAGDILARIDDRQTRSAHRVAADELRSAQARVAQAKVTLERATLESDEQSELVTAGLSARRDAREARLSHKHASAALVQAKADAAAQRSRLDTLAAQLTHTQLVAPFDGTVAARHLDPGARVGPRTRVFELARSGPPWVKFAVEPSRAVSVHAGMPVRIQFQGGHRTGVVEHVAPRVDLAADMVFVVARLVARRTDEPEVQPGLAARVLLDPGL